VRAVSICRDREILGRPEAYDTKLTKAEASKRIDALQEQTGRGA